MTETATAAELLPLDLGSGVVLAATTAADAAPTYALVDAERDRLRSWLPWVDGTRSVETEREFLASVQHANATGDGLHATIHRDGDVAGMVGLRVTPMHAAGEIGYWLGAAHTGRGVMTTAVAALLDLAFGPLRLHRVQLRAATGNAASRGVAQRLGLRHEGTLRDAELLADGFVDLEVYAVLAGDWPGAADLPGGRLG